MKKKLLKQRSEHNDGNLDTLEEISLHQFDIEKIECLDFFCKRLRILLLQNNLIGRIAKLKDLRYLNLALNNITKIENLEGCEFLEKLDLTVNFVEDLLSLESLKVNRHLKELYLVGNPCTQIEGYREFVIATLPHLTLLDGRDVERSERIAALQKLDEIRTRLVSTQLEKIEVVPVEPTIDLNTLTPEEIEIKRKGFNTTATKHDPETRVRLAKEVDLLRNGPEVAPVVKPPRVIAMKDGRVLQKNEGKFEYSLVETADTICLKVAISTYMDTSFVDVDVKENYIVVNVKGKILQLVLESEVVIDDIICERCKVNGELMVTMLKASSSDMNLKSIYEDGKKVNSIVQKKIFNDTIDQQNKPAMLLKEQLKSFDKPFAIKEVKYIAPKAKEDESQYDGEEYSDVPPLC